VVALALFAHPAVVSASIWRSSFWPPVDTRAYPILISVRTRGLGDEEARLVGRFKGGHGPGSCQK
jgi:hypothetical protein